MTEGRKACLMVAQDSILQPKENDKSILIRYSENVMYYLLASRTMPSMYGSSGRSSNVGNLEFSVTQSNSSCARFIIWGLSINANIADCIAETVYRES